MHRKKTKFQFALQLSAFNIFISDVRICEKFEFGRIWNCSVAFIASAVRRKKKWKLWSFFCEYTTFSIPIAKKKTETKKKCVRANSPKSVSAYLGLKAKHHSCFTFDLWPNRMDVFYMLTPKSLTKFKLSGPKAT